MIRNIIIHTILYVQFFIFGICITPSQSQPIEKTVVYRHEVIEDIEYGYRIPSIITASNGTLLAFAERRVGLHDHAQNDIVLKRSFDNGKTWGPLQVIADQGKNSLNDPLAVRLASGRILLMFTMYPYGIHTINSGWIQKADPGYDGPRNTRTFLTWSDDEGTTWAEAKEITKMIRPSDRISVGSPGIGIQLTRGNNKGRVVMPFYYPINRHDNTSDWSNAVGWSDDEGITWHISNDIPHIGHTGFGNEAQVVELSDGGLLYLSRNQGGLYRKTSRSTDGGQTWSNFRLDFSLPGTACQGSVLRYSWPEEGESMIIQSGPANKYARNQGTVKISVDEGRTWKYSRVIEPDYFAYSCLTQQGTGNIGLLYEADHYRTIVFVSLTADWLKQGDGPPAPEPYLSIPVVDLNDDKDRQVIVDKEKGQYLGHPTTVLFEDNTTMLTVFPKGHGRGGIVYKKSADAGLSWSDRLPTPESWATSREVPTLHRVVDKYGKKRLIMWSGLYPARLAVSEDDGDTWSDLETVGNWGGIVVMGSVIPLNSGKGHYMALFHDDQRFFAYDGKALYENDAEQHNSHMFTLYKTLSEDGGLTWSFPERIAQSREIQICEPGFIRSPDGNQLAVLLRENSRRDNSQIIFSNDEGKTWTRPRPLPNELTGDRHVLRYAPDGRLLVVFRDVSPQQYRGELLKMAKERQETNYSLIAEETGWGSPTEGDWVAWVGTYEDLLTQGKGQYRVRIKDNKNGWDTTYPGVELLPDGTFITTTYGHWEKGESPYILSVRFKLQELDKLANTK